MRSVSRIDPGQIFGLCFSEKDSIAGAQSFFKTACRQETFEKCSILFNFKGRFVKVSSSDYFS